MRARNGGRTQWNNTSTTMLLQRHPQSLFLFFFFFVLLPTSEQKGVLDVTQQKATFGFFSLLIKSAVSGLSKPLFNLQKCTPNDTAVRRRRLVRQESLT